MKNIIKTALCAALLIGTSSCSDFLQEPVLGQENLDTYFQNEEESLKQLSGAYQGIFWDDWWQIAAPNVGFEMSTDDLWMGNTTQSQSDWIRMAHYDNPAQDGPISNYWQYRYKAILRCNIVINKVADAPISNESLKKRIIAEAKFLRAFNYFELVKNFGGVPLVLEMKLPSEVIGIQRASIAETYAQIEKDLKEAIADLPKKSEYASTDLGRATKGAAQSYLGKAYLYQEKYAEAKAVLEEVINSGEYDLLPEFGQVWTIAQNNGKESVFEVQFSNVTNYNLGGRLPVFTGSRDDSGWSWGLPTSDLENAFKNAGDTERLKWTIVKHGDDVPGETAPEGKNYVITPDKHKSARINRKFYIPRAERSVPYDANFNNLNHRLLRYADVLLMYAEASNALGDDAAARIALNKVRTRAKLGEVTASGTALRDAIRTERRLELALEFNRLYDIRRWTESNGKKMIANLFGANGSFVRYNLSATADEYEKSNQKENSNKGINFREDRDLLFPIPHSEVQLSNGSIVQNPNF